MAIDMGSELENQNNQIDRINRKVSLKFKSITESINLIDAWLNAHGKNSPTEHIMCNAEIFDILFSHWNRIWIENERCGSGIGDSISACDTGSLYFKACQSEASPI